MINSKLLWILVAALFPAASWAQQVLPPQINTSGNEVSMPLGVFHGGRHTPIELRGLDARANLSFALPYRYSIENANLELRYTNSLALNARSVMSVLLDGRIQAQMPLNTKTTDHIATISLPVSELSAGYHSLGFNAAQHSMNECEDSSAPELFTQIDAMKSVLRLKFDNKKFPPSLAKLNQIFDSRLPVNNYRAAIFAPSNELSGDVRLRQAISQVSQYLGGMFDYIPVQISLQSLSSDKMVATDDINFSRQLLASNQMDGVIIGTVTNLRPYLGTNIAARITQGYIGIFPSEKDATKYVLVVSGTNSEEVEKAALALNSPELIFPDKADAYVTEFKRDKGYSRKVLNQAEPGWTSLASYGFKTTTMRGMYAAPAEAVFWSFPEILDSAQQAIKLKLNFVYGAGFSKSSALNVLLNGQFIQAIPLQNSKGGQMQAEDVLIPTVSLRAGENKLTFVSAVIGEDVGGACLPLFTNNLLITVFDDSSIGIPAMSDAMIVPDLALFGKTGLPYTRYIDGKGVGVYVTDTSPSTLNSAYTLLAKLKQLHKNSLYSAKIITSIDEMSEMESVIVVGALNNIPPELLTEMKEFVPNQNWQTFGVATIPSANGVFGWIKNTYEYVFGRNTKSSPAIGQVGLASGLGNSIVMTQFYSDKFSMPMLVVTASDSARLENGVVKLVSSEVWAALSGSAMLWTDDGQVLATSQPTARRLIGGRVGLHISEVFRNNIWSIAIGALVLFLVAAGVLWKTLKSRARMIESMRQNDDRRV